MVRLKENESRNQRSPFSPRGPNGSVIVRDGSRVRWKRIGDAGSRRITGGECSRRCGTYGPGSIRQSGGEVGGGKAGWMEDRQGKPDRANPALVFSRVDFFRSGDRKREIQDDPQPDPEKLWRSG